MRVLFLGGTDLGWKCCRQVLREGHAVTGVLTIPERFRISWAGGTIRNVNHRSFDNLCRRYDIPQLSVADGMQGDDVYTFCERARPDLTVVVGWYYVIPKRIRRLAPLGTVGIHASLLPRYRGGAPLVWSIINGDQASGVTLLHLVQGVDQGGIIAQQAFPIADDDEIGDVLRKAEATSLEVIVRALQDFQSGGATAAPQNEHEATFAPQRKPEDGLINWTHLDAKDMHNWVRAQSRPYPGAFTYSGGRLVRIWRVGRSSTAPIPGSAPGDLVGGEVCCADGRFVRLDRIQVDDEGPEISGEDLMITHPETTRFGNAASQEAKNVD